MVTGRRQGRLLGLCWALALGVHVAWVPNLIWFMVVPPDEPDDQATEVALVTLPRVEPGPASEGRASLGRLPEEIELPGTAPGGRSSEVASPRLERSREAQLRTKSFAQRALDLSLEPQPFRPERHGESRSPSTHIALPHPDDDDIQLTGVPSRSDAVFRRRGESLTGAPAPEAGSGGSPSEGNRVPLGDGELRTASAGEGEGENPRAARRGSRPRVASPMANEGPASAEAFNHGNLAGMTPSRQATPNLAWSEAVHEARVASGPGDEADHGAARPQRPGSGGASDAARGPGQGGQGRGAAGADNSAGLLLNDYHRLIKGAIRQHWRRFPPSLAFALHQGEVVLDIRVRHDGQVERIRVRTSSGFDEFDNLAVRAVHDASPLPPPPPEILFRTGRNYLDIPLSMMYRNPMFE
jgi:TonB family protein